MKKLVFLTGAGMSAESGISTFRDSGGLWEQYPVEAVASIQGYERHKMWMTCTSALVPIILSTCMES